MLFGNRYDQQEAPAVQNASTYGQQPEVGGACSIQAKGELFNRLLARRYYSHMMDKNQRFFPLYRSWWFYE